MMVAYFVASARIVRDSLFLFLARAVRCEGVLPSRPIMCMVKALSACERLESFLRKPEAHVAGDWRHIRTS